MVEGALALGFTLGLYQYAIASGRSESESRTLAFTAIVIANLSLIFFSRSGGRRVWRHIVAGNRSLWLIVAATIGAYALVWIILAVYVWTLWRRFQRAERDVQALAGRVPSR